MALTESEQICELHRRISRLHERLSEDILLFASYGQAHLAKLRDPTLSPEKRLATAQRAVVNAQAAVACLTVVCDP